MKRGDLFDQADANLVVGFGDTFDTSTERDIIISSHSVQGQLLHRIFRGNRERLDDELRKALRGAARVESIAGKPKGKKIRYALGTVAPLPLDARRVFAVAYSRQGNDYVTQFHPSNHCIGMPLTCGHVTARATRSRRGR